jgi:hypothetical protein
MLRRLAAVDRGGEAEGNGTGGRPRASVVTPIAQTLKGGQNAGDYRDGRGERHEAVL